MTDAASPSPRRVLPDEAEASLREILQQQIASAQSDIEAHLAELRRAGDGASLGAAENQLQGLSHLQRRIAHAGPGALASLRSEVTAYVAAAQTIAQQAAASAPAAQTAEAALHAASADARAAVASFERDMFERKIFDPYLHFTSQQDEEAYREREAERRHRIEEAKARATPEGDLAALRLARDQMKDAKAHGAGESADFQPLDDELAAKESRLGEALNARPQPNKQAAAAKPSADPLDDVQPEAKLAPELIAKLRATGVVLAEQNQDGHGVTARGAPAAASRTV